VIGLDLSWPAAAVAVLVALAWDRVLGEPPARWHPVVAMGRALGAVGPGCGRWRRAGRSWRARWPGAGRRGGGGGVRPLAGRPAVVRLAGDRALAPLAQGLLLGVLLKPLLAWRMLRDEVGAVQAALDRSLAEGASACPGW
jgi:adenosylcobinamide-phosphate synthase